MNINICLSCDENYAEHAAVVIASTLKNSCPDDELNYTSFDKILDWITNEK